MGQEMWFMTEVSVFIDDSDGYLGMVVGNELVIGSYLSRPIRRLIGKTVHMNELSRGLKLRTARRFQELTYELSEKYDLKLICGRRDKVISWLNAFVEIMIKKKRKPPVFYVDRGIKSLLRENIHPFYFRYLTIYVDKDKASCADILAWINLRRSQNRFIWSKIAPLIEEI